MKKIIILLSILGMPGLSVFAQTTGQVRPRVVKLPDNKPVSTSPAEIDIAPPPPLPEIDEDDVIRVETNLVKLPVSVTDGNGRFISGLRQEDFQIFENGFPQQIEYFTSVENPFTIVLLLDLSPSTKYKINEIQDAAISFFDEMRRDDRLMVVTFARNIDFLSDGTASNERVRQAIRGTRFGDGTSLYEAVDFANRLIRPIQGRKAIVLFSDGVDTSSRRSSYEGTVKRIEESNALLYSVKYNTFIDHQANSKKKIIYGAGGSPAEHKRGKEYLESLTKVSGGRLYEADTTVNLNNAFKNIAEELRRQYSIGYYPENEGKAGDRKNILVRVKRPNLIVRSKGSYIVEAKETDETN
jgi:VWFA-related protein